METDVRHSGDEALVSNFYTRIRVVRPAFPPVLFALRQIFKVAHTMIRWCENPCADLVEHPDLSMSGFRVAQEFGGNMRGIAVLDVNDHH